MFVTEPEITIYEDGFEGKDTLGRKARGRHLSDLVERIDQPMVIALDGAWGSGKSFFLKCWVGAHAQEFDKTGLTVYFDAFRHDYMDDPLLSLSSAIAERIEGGARSTNWANAPKLLKKLWRPAARIALAAGTAGISEFVNAFGDKVAAASAEEAEKLWAMDQSRKAAMADFRTALVKLTEDPQDETAKARKLIIVVDELDRCRPDYALSMLEVIKHFFDVPHVHFVLGVNMAELANTVRARYGNAVKAEMYLEKFVSLTMALPSRLEKLRDGTTLSSVFFADICNEIGVPSYYKKYIERNLECRQDHPAPNLRQLQKIATSLMLLNPSYNKDTHPAKGWLLCDLVFIRNFKPELFSDLKASAATVDTVLNCLWPRLETREERFNKSWEALLCKERITQEMARDFGSHSVEGFLPESFIRDEIHDEVEVFSLPPEPA